MMILELIFAFQDVYMAIAIKFIKKNNLNAKLDKNGEVSEP